MRLIAGGKGRSAGVCVGGYRASVAGVAAGVAAHASAGWGASAGASAGALLVDGVSDTLVAACVSAAGVASLSRDGGERGADGYGGAGAGAAVAGVLADLFLELH